MPTNAGAMPLVAVVRSALDASGSPAGAAMPLVVITTLPIFAVRRSHSEVAVPVRRSASIPSNSSGRSIRLMPPRPPAALADMNRTAAARNAA
jgi:hypothetical protein